MESESKSPWKLTAAAKNAAAVTGIKMAALVLAVVIFFAFLAALVETAYDMAYHEGVVFGKAQCAVPSKPTTPKKELK
jgi:hypothetical protein